MTTNDGGLRVRVYENVSGRCVVVVTSRADSVTRSDYSAACVYFFVSLYSIYYVHGR